MRDLLLLLLHRPSSRCTPVVFAKLAEGGKAGKMDAREVGGSCQPCPAYWQPSIAQQPSFRDCLWSCHPHNSSTASFCCCQAVMGLGVLASRGLTGSVTSLWIVVSCLISLHAQHATAHPKKFCVALRLPSNLLPRVCS